MKINNYMFYINRGKIKSNKNLYYKTDNTFYSFKFTIKYIGKLSDFGNNKMKTLETLKSIISIENIERFKEFLITKELYNVIKSIFNESFKLIDRYIYKINNIEYMTYKIMNEYTAIIQSVYQYLLELNEAFTKANIT